MSEVLTKDTSAERSAARWASVDLERKPSQELEKDRPPKIVHYVDTRLGADSGVALCGTKLHGPRPCSCKIVCSCGLSKQVECVVCHDLLPLWRRDVFGL